MKKLTILFAAIMLVCFSVPAMAVDWNFYGNARMATFYTSTDFGDGLNPAGTSDDDTDLQWDFQGNSRIGANVKAENISARFELAMKGSNAEDLDVGTRRMFATWDFGAGKLKIGKDYTPVNQFISGQVFGGDNGLLGIGTFYGRRPGQIELQFGAFKIALISNNAELISGMADETTTMNNATTQAIRQTPTGPVAFVDPGTTSTKAFQGDVDRVVPKIELGWGMAFDTWNFNLMGGAQYYSIEDVTSFEGTGTDDVEVTSWVIGGDIGWNFGPGYLKAATSYSENAGNAGWLGGGASWDGDDDTNDTNTFMAALVGGFKLSDMLSFEAGYGYRQDITDEGVLRDTAPWSVYLQSVIALAPGVFIIPEVGYTDFDDDTETGDDAGSQFYLGGKWQINF
jgi:hypothetical protein